MQKTTQESFEATFPTSKFSRRNCVSGLPDADEAVAKSVVTLEFNQDGAVSAWIEKGNSCLVEQLLVTLLKSIQTAADFENRNDRKILSVTKTSPSTNVFTLSTDSKVKLLRRYLNENFNFQGQTDYECRYLTYFASGQFNIVKDLSPLMTEEEMKFATEKMISVCEGDFGTVECKANALRVLAKFVMNSKTVVSKVVEYKDTLCDLMLDWTDSKCDDELRQAAAASLPTLPLDEGHTFSDSQFCKFWSAAFILAQDDELFIRSQVFKKLNEAEQVPGCSLKCLELLVVAFFQEITKRNTVEGFWTILALLLKDDFDVVAEGADDEEEDRLFEQSEMNMFAETVTLTKIVVDHLTKNQNIIVFLKAALNVPAKADHLKMFNQISHLNFDFNNSNVESPSPTNIVVLQNILDSSNSEPLSSAIPDANQDLAVGVDKSNIEDLLRGHEKEVVQQFIRRKIQSVFLE